MSAGVDVARRDERGEADAVRRLRDALRAGDLGDRLRRFVPALRSGETLLRSVRLERFPWKGAWAVEGAADLEPAGRRTPGAAALGRCSLRIEPLDDDRRGAAESEGPFHGIDHERGLDLRLSPADSALPALGRALRGRIRPDGEPLSGLQLLGHRFGRRAALRGRTPRGELVVLKVFARRRADRLARTMLSFRDAAADADPIERARTANVLWCADDRRSLLLEYLPGEPLRTSWGRAVPDLAEVGRVAAALSRRGAPHGEPWSAGEEIATIRRLADRLDVLDPELAGQVRRSVDALDAAAARTAAGDGAPARLHRDLHDGQIVARDGRVSVIDWDLAAVGPFEVDAGNFVAHLRLRVLQGHLDAAGAAAARAAFLRGAGLDGGPGTPLAAWECLAALRLAAVYGLRLVDPSIPRRLLPDADSTGRSS